ncbi:hypothetical protein GCM10009593_30890 [Microlunatus antarcticus]
MDDRVGDGQVADVEVDALGGRVGLQRLGVHAARRRRQDRHEGGSGKSGPDPSRTRVPVSAGAERGGSHGGPLSRRVGADPGSAVEGSLATRTGETQVRPGRAGTPASPPHPRRTVAAPPATQEAQVCQPPNSA